MTDKLQKALDQTLNQMYKTTQKYPDDYKERTDYQLMEETVTSSVETLGTAAFEILEPENPENIQTALKENGTKH